MWDCSREKRPHPILLHPPRKQKLRKMERVSAWSFYHTRDGWEGKERGGNGRNGEGDKLIGREGMEGDGTMRGEEDG